VITGKHDAAEIRSIIAHLIQGPVFSQLRTDMATYDRGREDYKLFLRTHRLVRRLNELLPEAERVQL